MARRLGAEERYLNDVAAFTASRDLFPLWLEMYTAERAAFPEWGRLKCARAAFDRLELT